MAMSLQKVGRNFAFDQPFATTSPWLNRLQNVDNYAALIFNEPFLDIELYMPLRSVSLI